MNLKHPWLISGFLALALTACSRSPDTQFYILNPMPIQNTSVSYTNLQIGIDEINTPAYTEKLPLMVYETTREVKYEEYHQWAENLHKNINRILRTNLNLLLPGAVVNLAPWDVKFKPNYHVQINIADFSIYRDGLSILRAEVLVFDDTQLLRKQNISHSIKVPNPTLATLVASMNANLNHLSEDIARLFKKATSGVIVRPDKS